MSLLWYWLRLLALLALGMGCVAGECRLVAQGHWWVFPFMVLTIAVVALLAAETVSRAP